MDDLGSFGFFLAGGDRAEDVGEGVPDFVQLGLRNFAVGTRRSRSLAGTAAPAPPPESPGRMSLAYSDGIGEVLRKVEGSSARYELTGDEIYVRARVISSRLHPNPFAEGDREMAWTQPLVPQR